MEQAVETSSAPNQTDARREGIPRMNTWARELASCPSMVTPNKFGLALATLIHVPAQLSALASSAVTRSPFLSRSQVTGKMNGMGLFPRLSRKCRGDSIVPNSWKSPNLSLSVSVVAEIPASGPRLGREPAVTEGSGICPGIASDSAVTTAKGEEKRGEKEDILRRQQTRSMKKT
ncbi:hypothetical protein FQN60_008998 [Etheostoma spectabile]|uniref:Uncharacterized protein n=1 Tax=Etheostoma spectabile TaxID=54343 RepID=A0A5J5CJU6_9PERO|nr:hypothetical protein FQN60_008998 [Etheostoma spectabile]